VIRKLAPNGTVSRFAGTGVKGFSDGVSEAMFKIPIRIAIDERDNLYVVDYGNNR
jgi:hypothetical protein